jgi:hypothetical protein
MSKSGPSLKAGVFLLGLIFLYAAVCVLVVGQVRDCYAVTLWEGDFDRDQDADGSDLAAFAADFGRTIVSQIAQVTSMKTKNRTFADS